MHIFRTITREEIIEGVLPRQLPQKDLKEMNIACYNPSWVLSTPLKKIQPLISFLNNLKDDDTFYTQNQIKKIYNNPEVFRYTASQYDLAFVADEINLFDTLEEAQRGAIEGITSIVKIQYRGCEYYALGKTFYREKYQVQFDKERIEKTIQQLKDYVKKINKMVNGVE